MPYSDVDSDHYKNIVLYLLAKFFWLVCLNYEVMN